ncbi:heparinase II/III family protein [Flagellimonas meishanensis]|uniref:heparinase II/III family protein n=1 Tax=Flagellimonas meishanensis TaxID=2873264 RepID=UPI001CA67886|nr:alginate lyase family protein [[Muricauda] meishanensis]
MLKKIIWHYNRLKLMGLKEILIHRIPQLAQKLIFGRLQSTRSPNLLSVNKHFFAPKYEIGQIEELFKEAPFTATYDFFDVSINVLEVDSWRADLKHGVCSPIKYYGKIKRQDFNTFGDIKIVSEPSRFHFLPFLAFKHISDPKARYDQVLEQILFDWIDQNPYLKSIQWTSGIEVGIRSVNLVYALMILAGFNALRPTTESAILTQLTFNYEFLKNHLSLFSSANNHLMAELMGLVVISCYCNVKISERNKWIKMLYGQIHAQINDDGVHMELCTRYHAEVSDQVLIAFLFTKASGNEVPSHIEKKLKSMYRFLEHVDYHDYSTVFGDNDEGFVINPYFQPNFSLYRSQLMSCNYLFGTSYRNDGVMDFRNYLLFGNKFRAVMSDKLPGDSFFKTSGYCFMYHHNYGIKIAFDAGRIGDSISAAHGHSDLLHFTLQQYTAPMIVDAGTYQYHSNQIFWRNYFRGIHAHNTISVNGANHAKINNRMSWISQPRPPKSSTKFFRDYSICQAEHDAFEELGIVHNRRIELDRSHRTIKIIDIIKKNSETEQKGGFRLHFHPRATVQNSGNILKVWMDSQELTIENDSFTQGELVIGDKKEPLGWFSPKFNLIERSCCFRMDFIIEHQMQLTTCIKYH